MQPESPWLDRATLLADIQKLPERAHELCEESRALRTQAQQLKSPWPHLVPVLPEEAIPQPDTSSPDPHELAMDALRLIRTIIDPFPIEWQIAIVKALTARTLIKARERTQPAQAALSA